MLTDMFDSWRHGGLFEFETLKILLEGQRASLKVLEINNNYSNFWNGTSYYE